MKRTIVTVACTLIALMAFAQTDSKGYKDCHRTNNGNRYDHP